MKKIAIQMNVAISREVNNSEIGMYLKYVPIAEICKLSTISSFRAKKTEKIEPIDLKDYAKFVLRDGTVLEQRLVLECVSSELVLKSGKVATK